MRIILFIILSLATISCKSQKKQFNERINVLFIGNSLTEYNGMTQTLRNMLVETTPFINIEKITFPGMSLSAHLTDMITSWTENGISTRKKTAEETTVTEKKILEKKWDIIIFQTGTVSVLIPENRDLKVNKAITDIKKLVSNPNCKFILFNTWPSKKGYPKEYCYSGRSIEKDLEDYDYCSPIIKNLEQEIKLINESYEILANKNKILRSNNGTKFYEILTKYPEVELYEDEIHSNKYGAFLNACIFYKILTNNKASSIKYNGEIEPKTAKLLKRIAD
ncbi:DUF4886 domain-containing protein [Psychroserpens ponticola]|uniref:DUF4886 domain-containing protein n=1 Tax=Psychroserpens ponticola TaxID=2932268 RepID=A0ABY7S3G5_9FLAO|nr:DUF4886 domain-containing protein [Psychroserpens ponticola]WCO03545.1 DUF4886 domain-containing protein [Psychroserpens ponticola]